MPSADAVVCQTALSWHHVLSVLLSRTSYTLFSSASPNRLSSIPAVSLPDVVLVQVNQFFSPEESRLAPAQVFTLLSTSRPRVHRGTVTPGCSLPGLWMRCALVSTGTSTPCGVNPFISRLRWRRALTSSVLVFHSGCCLTCCVSLWSWCSWKSGPHCIHLVFLVLYSVIVC